MRPPEPIGSQHQQEGFDCGNGALNRWLQQRALANERQGVSRTVLLCPDEGNAVIAYACLSAGAFVLAEVPGALRCNMPARCQLGSRPRCLADFVTRLIVVKQLEH
ncbi:MAG: hypothetical protein QM522_11355 [Chitinophagaceae bacterium]|nr:hypothetical protein [Chitinophagaceae bacterium]